MALCTDGVNKLVENDDNKERLEMLNWLSSNNHEAKYADILNQREKETGRWFLETEKFRRWLNQDVNTSKEHRTLFCYGIQGAGKTFISAIVVDELRQRLRFDDTVRIAFFPCNFREEVSFGTILASLLRQLLQENASQLGGLKPLYDIWKRDKTTPTAEEILGLLDSTISCFSKVFFVIDALDECRLSGRFQDILEMISPLQEKHNLGLLVTSRKIPIIADRFKNNPCVEICAHEEDIRRFLESSMRELRCVHGKPELRSEIVCTITKGAKGM